MMTTHDSAPAPAEAGSPLTALLRRRGVRQFVKFCIVGASSTLIDFAIYLWLIEIVHLQGVVGSVEGGRALAQCCSFLFAVTNGFIWNSRWTFHETHREGRHERYGKFVLTNMVGLALNQAVLWAASRAVPAGVVAALAPYLRDPAGFVGKVVAVFVVVFWNFSASKYWTFRR